MCFASRLGTLFSLIFALHCDLLRRDPQPSNATFIQHLPLLAAHKFHSTSSKAIASCLYKNKLLFILAATLGSFTAYLAICRMGVGPTSPCMLALTHSLTHSHPEEFPHQGERERNGTSLFPVPPCAYPPRRPPREREISEENWKCMEAAAAENFIPKIWGISCGMRPPSPVRSRAVAAEAAASPIIGGGGDCADFCRVETERFRRSCEASRRRFCPVNAEGNPTARTCSLAAGEGRKEGGRERGHEN